MQHASDADQLAFAQLLGSVTKPHLTVAGDGHAVLPANGDTSVVRTGDASR